MKNTFLLGTILASSLFLTHAFAQTVPSQTSPDIRQRQLQIPTIRPSVSSKPLIINKEEPAAKEIKGGLSFALKSIMLENASTFKNGELEALYADKLGKKITVSELNAIADDVTAYYRNNGYILTRAVVPPQEIKTGDVKLRVVEGFIDAVTIQGDDAAGDTLIKQYADKIRAEKPLNVETLERYLLLMEDLPGVEARAVLQPSPKVTGASDVVVNISRKPVEASAALDNRGSRFLGPEQLSLTASLNNQLTQNDQTQFRLVTTPLATSELLFAEIRREEQLGSEGTKALFSGSYIKTRPQHTLSVLDIEGTSYAFTAGLSHPVIRSRRENWFVNADATIRDVDLDLLNTSFTHDKTRVLGVATSYDFVDQTSAINRAELRYARGLGIATDTSQSRSRANGQPVFDKLTSRVSRIQPVYGAFSVQATAAGQYSPQSLLASEEFAIGGAEFGSAYDPAEITGDSGAAGRLELQYNEAPQVEYLAQYQLYGFYDIGRVWNNDIVVGSESKTGDLSSAGVGTRVNMTDQLSGGLEGSVPLTRKVAAFGADGGSPRVFFNLQYRY